LLFLYKHVLRYDPNTILSLCVMSCWFVRLCVITDCNHSQCTDRITRKWYLFVVQRLGGWDKMAAVDEQCERAALLWVSMRTADCHPAVYFNTPFALRITAVTVSVLRIVTSGVPRNFFRGWGGVQQIQLRTEDRENGDLGTVAP